MDDVLGRRRARRRIALAVAAPAAALGVVAAAAASLGGVNSPSLGADVVVIASCDTDGVTLAYTNSYDATLVRYQTTAVVVTSINGACNGKSISVTLHDGANATVGSGSATVTSGSATITLGGAGADASAVTGAAVIIT